MRKMLLAAAFGSLALSLAACGGSSSNCTVEALQKKGKDLQEAMTAALTKDPSKAATNAQAWQQKAQELLTKAQAAGNKPTDEVCKAYDELIEVVKK
ncbi:hypothetical protein FZC33_13205 [Labrys sp. KNU-23]|uniref:hypothetical protein n=1 Tax=Labrys sp. KNU-23 TaxID=2789216 RepID=UPI0011EF7F35|nr:hypothetical protein [Labrys sp. KNU-23]QEN87227.1 hypothetical protein FZC33_13205 [Labrys sp. KNU-23]